MVHAPYISNLGCLTPQHNPDWCPELPVPDNHPSLRQEMQVVMPPDVKDMRNTDESPAPGPVALP